MKKVVVASTNEAKVQGVQLGFERMFPDESFTFTPIKAISGVPDQPWGREETLQGAKNRVIHARTLVPDADFWVTNESGVEEFDHALYIVNWAVVFDGNIWSKTLTASFELPVPVADLVRRGAEVAPAFETIYGVAAAKNGVGGIGHLSAGNIPRAELIAMAVVTALIPFKNPDLYFVDQEVAA